jgi:hypothetical protein
MRSSKYYDDEDDRHEPKPIDEIAETRRWLMERARYNPDTAWMVAGLDGLGDDVFWEYDSDLSDVDGDCPF